MNVGSVALGSVLSVPLPHACLWMGLEQEKDLTRAFYYHLVIQWYKEKR